MPQARMHPCLVSLGANVGDRAKTLQCAIEHLAAHPAIHELHCSRPLTTAPVGGPPEQGPFLNAATRFRTSLSAEQLLSLLLEIERLLGRERLVRWGPRTIDLDLLLYGNLVLDSAQLVMPHPRMAYRRFVLAPAAEVAAEMVHPAIGWTVAELLANLERAETYVAIAGISPRARRSLAEVLQSAAGPNAALVRWDRAGWAPAAPPVRSAASFVEFWQARAEPLLAMRWPRHAPLVVSDDWFERPLREIEAAEMDQGLSPADQRDRPDRAAWAAACEAARETIVRPKLVIWIAHATEPTDFEPETAGPDAERGRSRCDWAARQRALEQALLRPGVGPVLTVDGLDWAAALAEAVAAVAAMR